MSIRDKVEEKRLMVMNPHYVNFGEMTREEIDKWVLNHADVLNAVVQIERTEYQKGYEDGLKLSAELRKGSSGDVAAEK